MMKWRLTRSVKKQITLEQLKRLVKEEAEYEDEEQYLATFKLVGTLQAGDPTDLDQDGIESCLEETTDMDPPFTVGVEFRGAPKVKKSVGVTARGKRSVLEIAEVPVRMDVEIGCTTSTNMEELVSDCIGMIGTILQDAMVNTDVKLVGKIRKVPFDQA